MYGPDICINSRPGTAVSLLSPGSYKFFTFSTTILNLSLRAPADHILVNFVNYYSNLTFLPLVFYPPGAHRLSLITDEMLKDSVNPNKTHPWRNFCIPRPDPTLSHLVIIDEIVVSKTRPSSRFRLISRVLKCDTGGATRKIYAWRAVFYSCRNFKTQKNI
jgi:hypothetical protein